MTPAHESLLNHASVRGVTCCHPMSGRYCAVGRELWLDYRAECVAEGGRARSDPAGFAEYVSRVIFERITGEVVGG